MLGAPLRLGQLVVGFLQLGAQGSYLVDSEVVDSKADSEVKSKAGIEVGSRAHSGADRGADSEADTDAVSGMLGVDVGGGGGRGMEPCFC